MLAWQAFLSRSEGRSKTLHHQRNSFPKWIIIVSTFIVIASAVLALVASTRIAARAVGCSNGTTLNFVAHQDDDLLFLSPNLLHSIQTGRCVRTIFVTAGDAGLGATYWQGREAGTMAAYAEMNGVTNSWTQSDAGITGHPIPLFTLSGSTNTSVAFMRLPDGSSTGSGFSADNFESLQKLWTGTISTIHAIDSSSSYSKADLQTTLTSLMTAFLPDQINTQDFVGIYGDGDHSDHHTVAYFVQAAQQNYTSPHTLTGFRGYTTTPLAANVTGNDLAAKENAFYTYGQHDQFVCSSSSTCSNTEWDTWLQRQYMVCPISGTQPVANAGPNQTITVNSSVRLDGSCSADPNGKSLTYSWTQTGGPTVTLSSSTAVQPTFTAPASPATLTFQLVVNNGQQNSSPSTVTISVVQDLALSATATASSQNTNDAQTANKAIDGVIDGYPGDYTKEWATVGGKAGSWLKLTWSSPQTVSTIVLYDRPNLNDQITGGNIQFSDGSSVNVGTLNNDGSAVTITFPAKTITSLQLNITSVSPSTANIGLAEIQVFGN